MSFSVCLVILATHGPSPISRRDLGFAEFFILTVAVGRLSNKISNLRNLVSLMMH